MGINGLPTLGFAIGDFTGALLTQDTISYASLGYGPQWGIFSGGAPVVSADTVVEFSYKEEYVVADYPIETGAFVSYDKVYQPFDVRVRYVAGGSDANRQALLQSIEAIVGDLNLYDVVSPEAVYTNANVVHFDYRRTSSNGVKLLAVDVWLREVRIAGTSAPSGFDMSNAASPAAADPVNGGTVQPTAAPSNISDPINQAFA